MSVLKLLDYTTAETVANLVSISYILATCVQLVTTFISVLFQNSSISHTAVSKYAVSGVVTHLTLTAAANVR